VYTTSSLMRADQDFLLSQMTQNIWRYLHAILVIIFFSFGWLSDTWPIILLFSALVINSLLALVIATKGKAAGEETIQLSSLYGEAFLFWLFLSSLTLANSLDQLLLARLASFDAVGEYAALWNILGAPFLLIASSIGYVALPLIVRNTIQSVLDKKFILGIGLVGATLVLWSFVAGDKLLGLVYGGKYQIIESLLTIFVITGLLRLIYIFPSIMLGGRANTRLLLHFVVFAIIGLCLHGLVGWWLIPKLGVTGAAYGSMANWIVRCGGGIFLVLTNKDKLTIYPTAIAV
jgi:O-antigen/teichoic acid export membrane protein